MFRTAFILCALPLPAFADWAPYPPMFNFDAAFAQCTAEPIPADPAGACLDVITASYVLKRAVAQATYFCDAVPLSACTIPFEEEGIPAFGMQIATDVDCDDTDVLDFDQNQQLPADHCIAIASDIMSDEGAVPLFTEVSCGPRGYECRALALIHNDLWAQAVRDAAGDDLDLADDLLARATTECAATLNDTGSFLAEIDRLTCEADLSARLWADLTADQQ